jgi:hypothetical protein
MCYQYEPPEYFSKHINAYLCAFKPNQSEVSLVRLN